MVEARGQQGNGSEREETAGRRLLADTRVLSEDLQEALDETGASLRRQLEASPYLTLGAALVAGYVLGGGLASRLTRMAFGAGARVAVVVLARGLLSSVAGDADGHGLAPEGDEQ